MLPASTPTDPLPIVRDALARHGQRVGALLPVLHAVQQRLGHVPRETVPVIAQALNLSRAEVHGVITYYHHFRSEPQGRCVVQVCRAEACRAMGGEALLERARRHAGCTGHAPSADGRFSVEPVYCLGLCASSPAAMVNDKPHARLTPQRLAALMDAEVRS